MKSRDNQGPTAERRPAQVLDFGDELTVSTTKRLFEQSINKTAAYAKFMVTVSYSSVGAYLALLKFTNQTEVPEQSGLILAGAPIGVFMLSGMVFVFSFLPKTVRFSPLIMEHMSAALESSLRKRNILNLVGTFVYYLGMVLAACVVLGFFGR